MDLSILPWLLIAGAAIFSLISLIWLLSPLERVGKHTPQPTEALLTPKVSVIVYSQASEEELMEYLDTLCAQDYPDYEVIVVCESTAASNEILSESCARRYPNVYVTFIPPGSHNLSRRKLALTLGMKAAKGEVVVTTVSNARIPSDSWLSELIAPFRGEDSESIDISMGYSHMDYRQMSGPGKWYREFNSTLTDAQWIGYALGKHPYRGDGYNLAFRRKIFFEHKGYSQSIYLHPGDDDIFINEVATDSNTAMVLSPESILSIEWGDASIRMWRARKEQYGSTARWLPRAPFRKAGITSFTQWAVFLLCIAATGYSLLGLLSPEPTVTPLDISCIATALSMLNIFWLQEILIYRRAAAKLEATKLWWALPLFWLAKPVLNLIFLIRYRRHRRLNFTWLRN